MTSNNSFSSNSFSNNSSNNSSKMNELLEKIQESSIDSFHITMMLDNLIEDISKNKVDPRIRYNISKNDLFNLGVLGSMLSCCIFIPQAYKIYFSKNVKGVSIYTFILSFCASTVWFTYNYLDGDYPSSMTSLVNIIVVSSIIMMILRRE